MHRRRSMTATALGLLAATSLGFAQAPPGEHTMPPPPPTAGNANGPPMGPPPAGGPPPGPRPPDHIARGPSLEAALVMSRAIVTSCKGYHVAVSVLDAEGTPKLYYVPDGTGGTHAYTGYRKAHTALAFKMPSGKVADATKADAALMAKYNADAGNFVSWAGGMPIMVGSEIIGAVGVSGAEPSAKDEACAVDGLAKAKALLK